MASGQNVLSKLKVSGKRCKRN